MGSSLSVYRHQCHNVPVSQEALLVTLLEFYLLFLHLVNFIKYGMGSNKYGVTLLVLVPIMLLISGSAAMYKNIFFYEFSVVKQVDFLEFWSLKQKLNLCTDVNLHDSNFPPLRRVLFLFLPHNNMYSSQSLIRDEMELRATCCSLFLLVTSLAAKVSVIFQMNCAHFLFLVPLRIHLDNRLSSLLMWFCVVKKEIV